MRVRDNRVQEQFVSIRQICRRHHHARHVPQVGVGRQPQVGGPHPPVQQQRHLPTPRGNPEVHYPQPYAPGHHTPRRASADRNRQTGGHSGWSRKIGYWPPPPQSEVSPRRPYSFPRGSSPWRFPPRRYKSHPRPRSPHGSAWPSDCRRPWKPSPPSD